MAGQNNDPATPSTAGGTGVDTRTVHAGIRPNAQTGTLSPDIAVSVNNAFVPGDAGFSANANPDITTLPYLYARWTNPTVRSLETRIATLETPPMPGGTPPIEGLATASGMAAVSTLFLGLLNAGDHLIVSDVCYPGVRELASDIMTRFGVQVSAVDLTRLDRVAEALQPNTRLIHAETPCNPLLRLCDIQALAQLAHGAGAVLSVDSTIATPVATRPLALGADYVIHSLTKSINGHGDAMGGMLVGEKSLIERLRSTVGVHIGATLGAQAAAQILRGSDTLQLRVQRSSANALAVAAALENEPTVTRVIYPGLMSHPQYALAQSQMAVPGPVLTFQVAEPEAAADRLAKGMRIVHYAVSLGHQRSNLVLMRTAELMDSTYHLAGEALAHYRTYAGDGIFRLSVGLEDPADVIADILEQLR